MAEAEEEAVAVVAVVVGDEDRLLELVEGRDELCILLEITCEVEAVVVGGVDGLLELVEGRGELCILLELECEVEVVDRVANILELGDDTYELVLCGSVDKAVPLTEAVVVVVADEATLLELVDCRDELCILLEVNCVVGLDD